MPQPARDLPKALPPQLWLVKEEFQFSESHAGKAVLVHVRKTTVLIHDASGLVTSGLWDAGGYARSHEVAELIHPFLLDKIDQQCRKRIAAKGTLPERIPLPGHAR